MEYLKRFIAILQLLLWWHIIIVLEFTVFDVVVPVFNFVKSLETYELSGIYIFVSK